jgi:hypothetical protein
MDRVSHFILKDHFRLMNNELLPHIIVTVPIRVECHLLKKKTQKLKEVQEESGHLQIHQSLNREDFNL